MRQARMKVGVAVVSGALLAGGTVAVGQAARPDAGTAAAPAQAPGAKQATERVSVYDGGLSPGWTDIGWSPRELPRGAPARLRMFNYGGWILYKPKLEGTFGALVFRFSAQASFGEFLEVRLDGDVPKSFPRIPISPELQVRKDGEWTEVLIPMERLNPNGEPFDRVVFQTTKDVGRDWVLFDKVALVPLSPEVAAALAAGGGRQGKGAGREARMRIDCSAKGHAISPLIYGIALDGGREHADTHQWNLGATTRRWGGNPTSRYNWKLGRAWNTANDWFFHNVELGFSYQDFLQSNASHGLQSALTVPMLGWVAKDTTSSGFPVAQFGAQQQDDNGAGNGNARDGTPLKPGPPTQTSVEASPEFVGEWVRAIREQDAARGQRGVHMYILDNEPNLWSSTHRDVHPEPLTYDELLKKTVAYGTAVRKADPEAVIAGPAEWGWTNYFWSAADFAKGKLPHSDRRAHGDEPLLPWYLKQLRAHEKKTGVRLLDVVDVHFYPQTDVGVGMQGATDANTNARRLRSTRGLWDPTYRDESWIGEPIQLIPRLKQWIAENYPGRGISIGEYNFGALGHMSGGLAQAETLGRFAQGGITSAYFWQYPPDGSPSFWAFRAYRNFDGKGGRFQDVYVPSTAPEGTSLFASRDATGTKLVAVVLNLNPDEAALATVDLAGCGTLDSVRVLGYSGAPGGFTEQTTGAKAERSVTQRLPPYSMTVLDLTVKKP